MATCYTSSGTALNWFLSGAHYTYYRNKNNTHSCLLHPTYRNLLQETLQTVSDQTPFKCCKRHWKTKPTPTFTDWFHMIEEINNMEEMVDIAKESTEKFDKLWSPWLVFRYSDHYTQLDMG